MAGEGWNGWWVVGVGAIGLYVGNKVIPANTRVKETEELLEITTEVKEIAKYEGHVDLVVQCQSIQDSIDKYRKGLLKSTDDTDTDSESRSISMSMFTKIKDNMSTVLSKLNPRKKATA